MGLAGPYLYEGGAYKFYTYPYLPVSKTDSIFDGSNPVVTTSTMFYDNPLNKLLTRTEQIRTDGKKITAISLYPHDYASGTPFIDQMITRNMTSIPIESVSYLSDPSNGVINILSGSLTTYNATNPFFKDTEFHLEIASPVSLGSFKFSGSSSGNLPHNVAKSQLIKDARYTSNASYIYDSFANLSQVNKTNGISSAILWGYNNTLPIAQVMNARSTEVYYNGFEEQACGTSNDSKLGLKSFALNGAAFILPTLTPLASGQKYLLSFWYKNTGGNWTFTSTLYTTLPASLSGYTLIDDVRIHPEGGIMNTMAYLSPRGQLRSMADEAGREKSYSYDAMNRLNLVKDHDQNILNQYSYHFSPAMPTPQIFYFNKIKSANYQKNDCTGGKTGTHVTYSVAAGSYASNISQANADALAQNELDTKGLANANLLGKCYYYNVVKTGTFSRTNCTGLYRPRAMLIEIVAGTYTSEISQADADAQAQSKLDLEASLINVSGTCYIPNVTFSVSNGQNTASSIKVTMRNVSNNVSYSTSLTTQGQGSPAITIPPGTYNIIINTTGPVGGTLLKRNGSNFDCRVSGTWSNITLGSLSDETLQFILSSGSCPPLD